MPWVFVRRRHHMTTFLPPIYMHFGRCIKNECSKASLLRFWGATMYFGFISCYHVPNLPTLKPKIHEPKHLFFTKVFFQPCSISLTVLQSSTFFGLLIYRTVAPDLPELIIVYPYRCTITKYYKSKIIFRF